MSMQGLGTMYGNPASISCYLRTVPLCRGNARCQREVASHCQQNAGYADAVARFLRRGAGPAHVVQGARGVGEFFVPGGMSGMGEYFASSGLGADAPAAGANAGGIAYMAALGAVAGLAVIGVTQSKKRLAGAGVGAVAGALVGWMSNARFVTTKPGA